jgi:hypothetical protein
MIDAVAIALMHSLPDAAEALSNEETAAVVRAIYSAMSAEVEGRA